MAKIAIERHLADESVTERVAQLGEADRRKNDFIALLAHELRNPLAPMLMALEIMRVRGDEAATVDRYRTMLDRQVHHLNRLVDDLLDVSRITRGKFELKKQRTTVDEFCGRAVEQSMPLIGARNHRLHVSLASPPLEVDVDLIRMAQVVSNLLNNAANYAHPRSDIFLSAGMEDGGIVIRVRDTGIGMAPETIVRAFELFMQGDAARTRERGGLGVGLPLVRSIVEMHGGYVEAFSPGLGKGSELIVRIPSAPPPDGDGASRPAGSL
jgi:signal transduction histidine kinase